MIVIKGNLIMRQAQNRISSETSSEQKNIVAFADLSTYDISNATIFEGDITVSEVYDDILVTGEVVEIGGELWQS